MGVTTVAARPPGIARGIPKDFPMRVWNSLVLTGETVGFVVPGLAWFAAWKAGFPPLSVAAIVVPAGACEGAVSVSPQLIVGPCPSNSQPPKGPG